MMIICVAASANADEIATVYECTVVETHGVDEIGKQFQNAILIYRPMSDTLDVKLYAPGTDLPPERLFSRLHIQTFPSERNNLHAVQYDPVEGANITPVVAWLMLETIKTPERPGFKFFSTGLRGLLTGTCRPLSEDPE